MDHGKIIIHYSLSIAQLIIRAMKDFMALIFYRFNEGVL